MKRLLCWFFSGLLLFLCGCGGQSPANQSNSGAPSSQTAALDEEDLLAQLTAALTDRKSPVLIGFQQEPLTTGKRVEVTPALLSAIADILHAGNREVQHTTGSSSTPPAPVKPPPHPSLTLGGEIRISGAGEPYLHATLRPEANHTLLEVQLGEESAEYPLPRMVYLFILKQVTDSLVDDTLEITGDFIPFAGPLEEAPTSTQWLECSAGLAALYTWRVDGRPDENHSSLEIFAPETGESLYHHEIGAEALRMEPGNFSGTDVRVLMADGAMWYLNSNAPDTRPYYFYLPKTLRDRLLHPYPMDRPVYRAFDGGTGQGAVWAVVDEEGLTWARRSRGGTISHEVILENIPPALYDGADFPSFFSDVRLMNGGQTLVATVVLPDSQMGEAGIFTYHISSGAMGWHFGMFRPMMADLRYLDDKNLLVAGEDEIFRLNVATGKSTVTPSPEGIITAATPDYENYVFSAHQTNPNGTATITLTTGDNADALLTATGGSGMESPLQIMGITPQYLILKGTDKNGTQWMLTRW